MRVVAMLVGVVGLIASGCGGCGTSINDYPAETAKSFCSKLYSCCTTDELKNHPDFGPDQKTCETNVAKSLASPSRLESSEKKGRLAFHSDKLQTCLDKYKALTCEQLKSNLTDDVAECDQFIEPKVAVGGACGADDECIQSTCAGESLSGDGVCAAFVAENGGCADGGVCDKGLYCAGGNGCQKAKADGTACSANFECSTGGCNGRDPDAGTAGTCGPKGGEGTTCYATTGCSSSGGASDAVFGAIGLLIAAGLVRRRGNMLR